MGSYKEHKDKNGRVVSYNAQVRIKGAPPQYASFKKKTDADRWIQQTEAAIREGRHFKTTQSKKHSLAQLIDRYMTDVLPSKKKCERRQGAQLLWWRKQIGHYLLSEVTPAIIGEQRDVLSKGITKRGHLRSPSTVVRYMAALSHALTVAVKEWGWIEDSPIRKVTKPKEPRGRTRFLNDDERMRLLVACKDSSNPYLYILVVLSISTGMRQGEILNLKWSDVDLEKGKVILHETKNNEIRQVPITGHALELLQQLRKVERPDTQLLFPGKVPEKPIDIRSAWEWALKRACISNFKYHDLRHTAASYLAMDGSSLAEIAEILGHKTLAMVKRYAHLSETHTANVVSRMNQKIFG